MSDLSEPGRMSPASVRQAHAPVFQAQVARMVDSLGAVSAATTRTDRRCQRTAVHRSMCIVDVAMWAWLVWRWCPVK